MFKNRNFVQKSECCSKIEILFKNRNVVQKSKLCSKIDILFKHRNVVQKSECCSKIEILFNNRYFGQKSKFCSNIGLLFKNVKKVLFSGLSNTVISTAKAALKPFPSTSSKMILTDLLALQEL